MPRGKTKPLDNTYYDLLGVPHDFKEEDLKKSFREAAKQYHPDRNKDPSAPAKFQKITEAYTVLKDPRKREAYNLEVGIIDLAQYSKTKHAIRRRRLGGYYAVFLGVLPAWFIVNSLNCLDYSKDRFQVAENRPKLGLFNMFLYARMWFDGIDLTRTPKKIVHISDKGGIAEKIE